MDRSSKNLAHFLKGAIEVVRDRALVPLEAGPNLRNPFGRFGANLPSAKKGVGTFRGNPAGGSSVTTEFNTDSRLKKHAPR